MGSVKSIIKYGCPTVFLLLIAIIAAGMLPSRISPKTHPPYKTCTGTAKIVEKLTYERHDFTHYKITIESAMHITDFPIQFEFTDKHAYESIEIGDTINMFTYGKQYQYPSFYIEVCRNGTYIVGFGGLLTYKDREDC